MEAFVRYSAFPRGAQVGRSVASWLTVAACVVALGCGASSDSAPRPAAPSPDDDTVAAADTDPAPDDGVADSPARDDATTTPTADSSAPDDPPPKVRPKPRRKADRRFKTSRSAREMSRFLVAPARAAFRKKNWPLAISYYSGLVAARGYAGQDALDLAFALVQENQYQRALGVLDRFIESTDDPKALKQQIEVRKRVAQAENPFSREFSPVYASKDARKAFQLGRKAFKRKKYGDALLYFRIGSALDPDLVGFFREMGATYDKLGATDKKVDYLGQYLHRRPFGKNAEVARKMLRKNRKRVARLTLASSLPCDRVWLNTQLVPTKLPVKKLVVGSGRYTALCYNIKYDIAYFEEAVLKPGSSATIKFNWAVVIDRLRNPFGRIRVENALSPGNMVSVPTSKGDGFGVVVPSDGRALKVEIQSLDRSRKETRYLKIAPGSKEVIKW